MKKYKRVTAYLQDDENTLSRQGRLVESEELGLIDKVFKMFGIQYDVDDIPPNTRLYSLTVSMRDRYISDNLLTRQELTEHIAPYLGKGGVVDRADFRKLLNGAIPQIYKTSPAGEIVIGYELTVPRDESRSIFKLASLRLRSRKAADPA